MITEQQIQPIFVAWQQPDTRRYYPVGRLSSETDVHGDLFEFTYICGAIDAAKDGFRPFLAFPELHHVYRSHELFPFFANRLMSPKRPDFADHLQRLGLDMHADPMLILARSGGTRATDSIELFALPAWDLELGGYQTFFWMHGFRHLTPQQQARVLALERGEELHTQREPANPWDSNAIQLRSADGSLLGYVPRYLASDAVHLLGDGHDFRIYVQRVNQDPAPMQQRLLCRLEAGWPEGSQPLTNAAYQPIASEATALGTPK